MAENSFGKLGKLLRSNSLNKSDDKLVSINMLRQKRINEESLSQDEWNALNRYEKYRKYVLENATSQEDFEEKYKKLVTLARYTAFKEFLSDTYSINSQIDL